MVSAFGGLTGSLAIAAGADNVRIPGVRLGFMEGRMVPVAAAGASVVVMYNDINLIQRAGSSSPIATGAVPNSFIVRVRDHV